MRKKTVFLGKNDSLVLNAIIANLTVVLDVKNRIRSIPAAVQSYCREKGLKIYSSGIYKSIQYLEETGFITKVGKTKANGGKKEVMVYEFQEEFFNSVNIKEEKRRSKQTRPREKNPTPAKSDAADVKTKKEFDDAEKTLIEKRMKELEMEIIALEEKIKDRSDKFESLKMYLFYKEKKVLIIGE